MQKKINFLNKLKSILIVFKATCNLDNVSKQKPKMNLERRGKSNILFHIIKKIIISLSILLVCLWKICIWNEKKPNTSTKTTLSGEHYQKITKATNKFHLWAIKLAEFKRSINNKDNIIYRKAQNRTSIY